MLDILFPFSYFGISFGFLIGIGITAVCFGFLSVGIILLCISLGMIRIMPLVNLCKRFTNALLPDSLTNFKENIRQSFKIKATKLEDTKYIFMWNPHGVFTTSQFFHIGTKLTDWGDTAYPVKGTAFNGLLWLPFMGEFFEELGAVPTEYHAMKKALETSSLSVAPGGMREMLYPGSAIIGKRRGIFKMALETGTPLVPIVSVGEDELCQIVQIPSWIQDWFAPYDACICIPTLKSVIKLLYIFVRPLKDPVVSVMGEPIHVDKIEEPTEKDIADLRSRYIEGLKNLYKKETGKTLEIR
jgi:2-acylglycerol O-acyltransferase 2